jgi:hypothetical protein
VRRCNRLGTLEEIQQTILMMRGLARLLRNLWWNQSRSYRRWCCVRSNRCLGRIILEKVQKRK